MRPPGTAWVENVRSIAYAVGQTIEVGPEEVDLSPTREIRRIVGIFANERGEVVELTEVPARMSEWEGFGGRRRWSVIGLALISPTFVGLVAYCAAWTTGLARFGQPAGGSASPIMELVIGLVLANSLWTALSSVLTAGEEIGW